eukprot:14890.XXX_1149295_1148672_1 [CDS] Oithona nana genome sequencing.
MKLLETTSIPWTRIKVDFSHEMRYLRLVPQKVFLKTNAKRVGKVWISIMNNDGLVICQESFVGALAMIEGLQKGKVGETFRRIFADKPENCDEVSKEEVEKFVMTDNTYVNDQFVENFQIYLDANQDGIITCYEFLDRFYRSIWQNEKMKNFGQENFVEKGQFIQNEDF